MLGPRTWLIQLSHCIIKFERSFTLLWKLFRQTYHLHSNNNSIIFISQLECCVRAILCKLFTLEHHTERNKGINVVEKLLCQRKWYVHEKTCTLHFIKLNATMIWRAQYIFRDLLHNIISENISEGKNVKHSGPIIEILAPQV